MTTDAQKRASAKYDAENTRQYHLKLNTKTDRELIQYLAQCQSVQGTIKAALRAWMDKQPE